MSPLIQLANHSFDERKLEALKFHAVNAAELINSEEWAWFKNHVMFPRMGNLDQIVKGADPVDVRLMDRAIGAYNVLSSVIVQVEGFPQKYQKAVDHATARTSEPRRQPV